MLPKHSIWVLESSYGFWIFKYALHTGSEGKASACNAGDLGSIPGSGRSPWRRKWQPIPVLFPGKSHGQRSLVDYSLWDRKESDTTERLHFHFQSHSWGLYSHDLSTYQRLHLLIHHLWGLWFQNINHLILIPLGRSQTFRPGRMPIGWG